MSDNYPDYPPTEPYYPRNDLPPMPMPMPVAVQKKRHPLRIVFILLVLLAIGLGVFRYFGPILVTQSFLNDVYSYKTSDALNLVCPAQQSQVQTELEAINFLSLFKVNIDTSHISYNIQSESLNSATVAVSGTITANSITSKNIHSTVALEANGLWWCIDADNSSSSG
ncbi:MAG TPA: hypothetical protein VEV19_10210 [Ktedonobacteraceae bacterium]|nr:hypothetical protein [Ktedonobacteraceae bacterium]